MDEHHLNTDSLGLWSDLSKSNLESVQIEVWVLSSMNKIWLLTESVHLKKELLNVVMSKYNYIWSQSHINSLKWRGKILFITVFWGSICTLLENFDLRNKF